MPSQRTTGRQARAAHVACHHLNCDLPVLADRHGRAAHGFRVPGGRRGRRGGGERRRRHRGGAAQPPGQVRGPGGLPPRQGGGPTGPENEKTQKNTRDLGLGDTKDLRLEDLGSRGCTVMNWLWLGLPAYLPYSAPRQVRGPGGLPPRKVWGPHPVPWPAYVPPLLSPRAPKCDPHVRSPPPSALPAPSLSHPSTLPPVRPVRTRAPCRALFRAASQGGRLAAGLHTYPSALINFR